MPRHAGSSWQAVADLALDRRQPGTGARDGRAFDSNRRFRMMMLALRPRRVRGRFAFRRAPAIQWEDLR